MKIIIGAVIGCILIGAPFSGGCFAEEGQYSLELQKFLELVKKYYYETNRWDYDEFCRKYPRAAAAVNGNALREQFQYVKEDPSNQELFESLKKEFPDYYKDLVQKIGGKSASTGESVTADDLLYRMFKCLSGQDDKKIKEAFHVKWEKQKSYFEWYRKSFPPEYLGGIITPVMAMPQFDEGSGEGSGGYVQEFGDSICLLEQTPD